MTKFNRNLVRRISVGVFLLLIQVNLLSAQGPVSKFNAQGVFASFGQSVFTESGYETLSVYVSQGMTVAVTPQVYLYFDKLVLEYGVLTDHYGFGIIPNTSVSISPGGQQLTLNVDLATISPPNFYQSQSVTISGCTTYVPPTDLGGGIALNWDRTNVTWSRTEGHTLSRNGNLTTHIQGTTASFSANLQGTVFGETLELEPGTFSAQIGTNHNVSIEVQKVK